MSGRRLELAALCAVVVTLPFHRFGWGVGGQSVSPTEAALLLTAALVAIRRVSLTLQPPLPHAPLTPQPPRPHAPLTPQPPLPHAGEGERAARCRRRDAQAGTGGGCAQGGDAWPAWAAFDGPIVLFLVAALLSLFATQYLRLSFRELRTLIVEPVLFWYLCRAVIQSPRDAAWLVGALGLVTVVVAILGLAQLVVGGAVTDVQGVRRVLGTYTSPNHFALLLGRSVPFLLAVAWAVPRWRLSALAGAALCGGALLATFSVGGWLGTGLAVLMVAWLLGGRRPVLALVLAGGIAAAVVFLAAPVERLAGRLDPRQGTSFARVQLWQAGLELVGQSPLFGIGLDNFLYRYPAVIPPDTPYEPNLSHPHNLVLQFWLQLGAGGVVALGWLLWRFVRLAWPPACDVTAPALKRALAVGALGSMTDFVAHGLVDNSYFLPDMAIVFWLTVAVAAPLAHGVAAATTHAETRSP